MPIKSSGWRPSAAAFAALLLAACAMPPPVAPPQMAEPTQPAETDTLTGNYLAARYARSVQDTGAAAKYFAASLADDPDNVLLMRRTFILMVASGQVDKGVEMAQRLVAAGEADPLIPLLLSVADIKAGNFASAVARMDLAPRTGLNTLITPMISAWAQAGDGKVDEAFKALAPLGENQALGSIYDYHSGLINEMVGRDDAAEASYLKILDRGGAGTLRVVEAYARFLQRHGRVTEARALFAAYQQRTPDSSVAQALVESLAAPASAPLVPNAAAGAAETLYTAAAVLSREDAGEVVELYLQLALYLQPQLDAARMLIGDLMENRQNWDDAITAYRVVPASSPYYSSARVRLAWSLNSKGNSDEAIALLRSVVTSPSDRTEALLMLGDLLRGKERYADAVREYDRALARVGTPQPRHWAMFYARGIAYERSKQWPKAEADFLKALQLQPDQPQVLNYLGYTWVDRGERLEDARRMIERAVELRPNDGFIVDSLGWALYRMGDYEEAVVRLERAVELQAEDPVINDHLGDAYWRVGRANEARFQWARSLRLKPESDARAATERKLQEGLPPARQPVPARAASNG